jgi:hypothetical protein
MVAGSGISRAKDRGKEVRHSLHADLLEFMEAEEY